MPVLPVLEGKYGFQTHVETGRRVLPWHRYRPHGPLGKNKIIPQKIHPLTTGRGASMHVIFFLNFFPFYPLRGTKVKVKYHGA